MRDNSVRGPAIDLGEFERRLRAPQRKEAGGDPLGELARLIQGEPPPADPYRQLLDDTRSGAPAPQEPPPLRGSYEEARQPVYDDQGYEDLHIGTDADFAAAREDDDKNSGNADHGAEGGWSDDAQYLDYGEERPEPYDESDGGGSWFRPWHAVAAISLLAIASIGWGFAHRGGDEAEKEIATITAPDSPVKVKPTAESEAASPDAGGAAVLDRKDSEPVKQVVNNQEQAVEPTLTPNVSPPGLPQAPTMPAPKKVKSVTVRPDGTRVDDAEAALPPAVSRATRAPEAELPAPAPSPAKPTAKPKTPAKAPPKAAAVAPTEEAAVPTEAAPAAPVAKGGYAVQFGAAPSEAEASALTKSVAAKYGAALGGHRPGYARATVGDKTVYRVRVGGMSKESAAAICGKVKASGGSCFIAGN